MHAPSAVFAWFSRRVDCRAVQGMVDKLKSISPTMTLVTTKHGNLHMQVSSPLTLLLQRGCTIITCLPRLRWPQREALTMVRCASVLFGLGPCIGGRGPGAAGHRGAEPGGAAGSYRPERHPPHVRQRGHLAHGF